MAERQGKTLRKKIGALMLALALAAALALGCFAAEPTGTVTYDGQNLAVEGDMSGFSGMVPGLPKAGAIQLKNISSKRAHFYLEADVLQSLLNATANQKDTAYTVSLSCGDTVLYGYDPATGLTGSLVGGLGSEGLEELNDSFAEPRLVATLAPGETTELNFSITPDARSTNDQYQAAQGLVEFRFLVSDVEGQSPKPETIVEKGKDQIITQTRYLVQAAKTGDTNLIFVAAGVLVLALLVLFIARKKDKDKDKNHREKGDR